MCCWIGGAGRWHPDLAAGESILGARVDTDDRHLLERPDPHRRGKNSGRKGRGGAVAWAGADARSRRFRARAAQDRHPAAPRRQYDRLGGARTQPGDDPPPPFSFVTDRITTRQIACHITTTQRGDTCRDPRQFAPLADVFGRHYGIGPRYCPSIEDKIVRFADTRSAPDFSRTGRARRRHDLSERHLDLAAARRCRRRSCAPFPVSNTPSSGGRAMPSNTISSIRVNFIPASRPAASRALFCRPDQRYHRL